MRFIPVVLIMGLFLVDSARAALVTFERTQRAPTAPEIGNDPNLAGKIIYDWFLTSTGDILSINNVVITIDGTTNGSLLYQNSLGTDVMRPSPVFIPVFPALAADSWISTPGNTSTAGGGFSTPGSTWFDSDNNGPQIHFNFARLTVPSSASGSFAGFVSIPSDDGQSVVSFPIIIPEPASTLLAGMGLFALVSAHRWRDGISG